MTSPIITIKPLPLLLTNEAYIRAHFLSGEYTGDTPRELRVKRSFIYALAIRWLAQNRKQLTPGLLTTIRDQYKAESVDNRGAKQSTITLYSETDDIIKELGEYILTLGVNLSNFTKEDPRKSHPYNSMFIIYIAVWVYSFSLQQQYPGLEPNYERVAE